jgi:hypothetical protein
MTTMSPSRLLSYAAAALVAAACGGAVDEKPGTTGEVVTGVGGASSATASSSGSGAASSSSGSGASGAAGGAGGSPPDCPDNAIHEPNESEDTAFLLTMDPIDDCDDSGATVSGVISGANDVDWFRWLGDDSALCPINDETPARTLTQDQGGILVCKYVRCMDQEVDTEFDCPGGTSPDVSGNSIAGCCGSSGFEFVVNCTGTTDEVVETFIKLEMPSATAATCNGYDLGYHF